MRIPQWDQNLVEKQVAFCLGVGGLGSTVAIALCRLGIKKIYLLDYDVVDSHNINRQALFSVKDIGKSKVTCAINALDARDNIQTELVGMDMNALDNWDKIVTIVKECTVGAVQSLCLKNNIPMVNGGTFQTSITVDYFKGNGSPCMMCISDLGNEDIKKKLLPDVIESHTKLDFIPKARNPIGASNIMVAATCSNMMVNNWIMSLLGETMPTRLIFYYNMFDLEKWTIERDEKCMFCNK